MSLTKIVATIGPATESPDSIEKLIESGVSVFRLNTKHNAPEWHELAVQRIKRKGEGMKKNIATILDLQGPSLRLGTIPQTHATKIFHEGDGLAFGIPDHATSRFAIIPFAGIEHIEEIRKGQKLVVDDGAFECEIMRVTKDLIYTVITHGEGRLRDKTSINVPEAQVKLPSLTSQDREYVARAVAWGVDYVALSFVRDASDITTLRRALTKQQEQQRKKVNETPLILAKIETAHAVHAFDEIAEASDAIMIARGDLGVEIALERLPKLQKHIIKTCREKAKPVIVATQMLKSMIDQYTPTRAEVADVANAVFDKTDALMLSEETATGHFPLKAVHMMGKIARYNETLEEQSVISEKPQNFQEIVISSSIAFMHAHPESEKGVKGYIVFTESGTSARLLSRLRPHVPVYAFTAHASVARTLALSYGVHAFQIDLEKDPLANTKIAIRKLLNQGLTERGEKHLVIFGNNVGTPGANNNLSIVTI